jgi:hypothetical protein
MISVAWKPQCGQVMVDTGLIASLFFVVCAPSAAPVGAIEPTEDRYICQQNR